MSNRLSVKNVKGLVPALDPKAIEQPFVIDGRNFAVDFQGPYSAFASIYSSYVKFINPKNIEDFDCDGEILYCTDDAIYSYDSTNMWLVPRYVFTAVTSRYPWTKAKVNGTFFFARRDVGVIWYTPATNSWGNLADVTDTATWLPTDPVSVTQSYGRLAVLGTDFIVWSAQDDGFDLETSLQTGAGAQKLSIIGGDPQKIVEVSDGLVVFTTEGLLKGWLNQLPTIYTWLPLTRLNAAINPFCILESNTLTYVFLDTQGLYTTNGKEPAVFQQLFSEFITRKLFPSFLSVGIDLEDNGLFRLFYDSFHKWLIFSIVDINQQSYYSKAYVLYVTRDEWGSFDFPHYAFVTAQLGNMPNAGLNATYIDINGYLHSFKEQAYSETSFDLDDGNILYTPTADGQSHYEYSDTGGGTNVLIGTSSLRLSDTPQSIFANKNPAIYTHSQVELSQDPTVDTIVPVTTIGSSFSGEFGEDWNLLVATDDDWNADDDVTIDWNAIDTTCYAASFLALSSSGTLNYYYLVDKIYGGLDSWVKIGLFRYNDNQWPDEMTLITDLAIGMYEGGTIATIEDWMTDPDTTEDWNTLVGPNEDWGAAYSDTTNYNVEIIATVDGATAYATTTPTLKSNDTEVSYYSANITGIWHIFYFYTAEANDAFHLRYLEFAGSLVGRYH